MILKPLLYLLTFLGVALHLWREIGKLEAYRVNELYKMSKALTRFVPLIYQRVKELLLINDVSPSCPSWATLYFCRFQPPRRAEEISQVLPIPPEIEFLLHIVARCIGVISS